MLFQHMLPTEGVPRWGVLLIAALQGATGLLLIVGSARLLWRDRRR